MIMQELDQAIIEQLSDDALAEYLRAAGPACWALAMGGTRRAYLADGGTLSQPSDLDAYYIWAEAVQRALFERLFRYGVQSVILIGRIPSDRGPAYAAFLRETLQRLVGNETRRASYERLNLRVRVAGDLEQIAAAVDAPALPALFQSLIDSTAHASGPVLTYLFRGSWHDPATEEAEFGYRLGVQLGRTPNRDELVKAYYREQLPPLSVYLGSGRPRIGMLRPPFLCGNEDLYWSHSPLMRLDDTAWRRIIIDHLWARKTTGGRNYGSDDHTLLTIRNALLEQDGRIIGVGKRHPLGFWIAE
jgi:hypothetical protein